MEIPYVVEEREDTGLINSKLGIWIFLASEVMLFGGLFSAYIFLRMAALPGDFERWASELSVPMATVNTVVLISSSVSMVMAWASLKMKDFSKYKMYLGITIFCSFVFLTIKYFEYSGKFAHDIYPSSNTFMAIYFTLTGLHVLHIIGGVVVMLYFYLPISHKMWDKQPEQFTNRIEVFGLYWHFVDLVWIFLFPVLYLL
ncbi:cytochrome c oxidase subunit 3 [Candidatus Marinimicrobia bacterium]|jgi:heme/copper-type cytochrome/quinol oxidase subunit 3|nr:heme-copper oxidase subunit III [bacterium]MDC0881746.1 cytochrome c oxidase subunit 3 [Candidatus Neomarinimicrobiota bacterium]MDC0911017.1 cytochrome c oxidase subunit 3 [Candidatus Neomarinimicrobiota bacterium]|tara:strand:+ start:319 stop:918 length:600 start_codon:yes stop_codon:yes gene_type:complete